MLPSAFDRLDSTSTETSRPVVEAGAPRASLARSSGSSAPARHWQASASPGSTSNVGAVVEPVGDAGDSGATTGSPAAVLGELERGVMEQRQLPGTVATSIAK
jgi:hypothetical protein